MKLTISFKHLEHTPAIDERIKEKSDRFSKFLDGNCSVKWVCYVTEGVHYAEIELYGSKYRFHAKGHSDSLYKTLDLVAEKMEKQLYKKKDKWKDNIHRVKEPVINDPEAAWLSKPDEDAA